MTPENEEPLESGEGQPPKPDPAEIASEAQDVAAPDPGDRDRLKDQLLRTAADFENFRKRAKRDVEEAERRGREDSLRELLTIVDNLERAVEASSGATDAAAVADGVRMVLRQFDDVATRLGVSRVPTVGERFDPTMHDAVQQEATDEHPPGTILKEVVPGYQMNGRLVRAAMVVVARPKPATPPPEQDGAG